MNDRFAAGYSQEAINGYVTKAVGCGEISSLLLSSIKFLAIFQLAQGNRRLG